MGESIDLLFKYCTMATTKFITMKKFFSVLVAGICLFSCKTKNTESTEPAAQMVFPERKFESPQTFEDAFAYLLQENGSTNLRFIGTTNVQYSLSVLNDSTIIVNAMWRQPSKGLQLYTFVMTSEKLVSTSRDIMINLHVIDLIYYQILDKEYMSHPITWWGIFICMVSFGYGV